MRTKVKKWFVKHGNTICAVAVSLASLSSLCCRGTWYQPEENDKPTGSSSWRDKQNDSKVYVYPTTGPKINYEVNGRKKIASTEQYKSFQGSYAHAIPTGTKASITNWVNESGGTEARLLMGRISSSFLDTAGYWSPDSSRNYTIFG